MNWIQLTRFLHIFSALIFIGGIFARQIVRAQAKKAESVRDMDALFKAAGRIESLMVIPGNMSVLALGVILAIQVGAPIFGFLQGASRNWLLATNILLVLGSLNVPLIFLPRGKIFDQVMKDSLAQGKVTPELQAALNDRTVRIAHFLEMSLLVIVVILMVFKPF
jgi:uncharacterized membrane protein